MIKEHWWRKSLLIKLFNPIHKMKKRYFLYFLLVSFFTNAQIINFSDADLKAKLLSASPPTTYFAKDLSGNYTKIDTNNNNEIEVSEALQISYLDLSGQIFIGGTFYPNNTSNLTGIEYFTNLKYLDCRYLPLVTIDATPLINLEELFCGDPNLSSPLTTLNVTGLNNLINLRCFGASLLTSVDVSTLTNIIDLWFYSTGITALDVSSLTNLLRLVCSYNQFTSIDVSNNINLQYLSCNGNQITNLDVSMLNNLISLQCRYSLITSLDVSMLSNLNHLQCYGNPLTELNIKNGNANSWTTLDFYSNPNLEFICADDEDIDFVQQKIDTYGYTSTCHVNSYCSFTSGGTFYDIEGNVKYDANSNGCDAGDLNVSNLNLSITDGTTTGSIIANTTGDYYIPVQAGMHTVTPNLENPSYFNISPSNFTVDFPTDPSPFTQDFCVTTNGVHSDVEIMVLPTTPARPGFDAVYKIIYRNKGTEIESGSVSITFDETILDYVSSTPLYDNSGINTFNWNYTNLLPFETREIEISFNVNSETETPAVNIGDVLNYTVSNTTSNTDETPTDNTFTLNQTVVGSYDPNDKTCLEGNSVTPSIVGEYVHYIIRFENTGTFSAQNIVVKDIIDASKFDVSTLVPLHASHEFYTRIKDNKVEFIFENINLDFNDATNDGYVAFKVKTLPILTVGDMFSNEADIYFDYNYPILTNEYLTTIDNLLNNQDFSLENSIKVITSEHIIEIVSDNSIRLENYTLYNISGQEVATGKESEISTAAFSKGVYFIKLDFDKASITKKIVIK